MSVGMVRFVTEVGVAVVGVGSVAMWVKGRRRERFES